jgi:hypothetical protein
MSNDPHEAIKKYIQQPELSINPELQHDSSAIYYTFDKKVRLTNFKKTKTTH